LGGGRIKGGEWFGSVFHMGSALGLMQSRVAAAMSS